HRGHARSPARLGQPGGVQLVVLGSRAEVPEDEIAVAGKQDAARALVARPFANVRARDVANVVLVEQQQRADVRGAQRCPGLLEAVGAEAREVDALLPVDRHRGAARCDVHALLSFTELMIVSGPGRNASSSGGLYGIGVSAVASRQASSSEPSACSVTRAMTSPAQPPLSGPSSTTSRRVVRSTDAITVSMSSGLIVRRSITSQSMPSRARASAAARESCTPFITDTIVRSEPALAMRAWPKGIGSSPTSPFKPSRRLCSRKSTGFSSRIACLSRPLASPGVEGQAILSPGTEWNQPIGVCEWIAPKRPPAPTTDSTTSGTLACSFERYQYFVHWLTMPSITSGRKSPNMISITGRLPDTALPKAAPISASSEIGVSNTRASPYFSASPGVVTKTPPATAMSSPKRITLSSRASSSSRASRTAVRNSTPVSVTVLTRQGPPVTRGAPAGAPEMRRRRRRRPR